MKQNGKSSRFTMTEAGAFAISRDGTINRDNAESNRQLRKQVAERNAVLDRILPTNCHIATPAMD